MAKILMMPAKLATPGFLKIKIFQSKGYDVIIPIREVIISSILQGFDQKTITFEGWF